MDRAFCGWNQNHCGGGAVTHKAIKKQMREMRPERAEGEESRPSGDPVKIQQQCNLPLIFVV
jgi:hypothetical protein